MSDVDTAAIVGKYLSRQTTGTRVNADADTAAENQAILESIAISLLLNPQAALSVILNSKNNLQQLISSDVEIIDYITAAIGETQNSDAFPSSTADLVDAQTALIELDRIGRIDTSLQAFTRYQNSISNFLNNQLAPLLKRNPTGEFNRSGLEAKQDLFNSVSLFIQAHTFFISQFSILANAVSDFNSVDLSRVVHTQTIARVRTSLTQIKSGMDSGEMSNTVAALELLAGSASLQSISNAKKLYDDTVPLSRQLFVGPKPTTAFIESSVGPLLTTTAPYPHSTSLAANGGIPQTFELPYTGKSGSPFVCSSLAQATFNVPPSAALYVDVTPGSAPGADGTTHYSIPLISGVRSVANVISDINAVFGVSGPIATDFVNSDNAIILLGAVTDTKVQVLVTGPGTFNPLTGVYTPDPPSVHELLGFFPNQTSTSVDAFDLVFLQRFFKANYGPTIGTTASLTLDGRLRIDSGSADPSVSALQVAGQLMSDLGFSSAVAVPASLQVTDIEAAVLDPTELGVLPGSVVHASTFINAVSSISGNQLLFDPSIRLPLTVELVRVVAPSVVATQNTMAVLGAFGGAFDNDILPLQGLLSPLLTTPSLAQVNDALRAFQTIKTRLVSLLNQLQSVIVSDTQKPADATAQSIIQTLEERGLDRALDLLTQCLFSEFFGLTSETVSKSTRFMKTMETVVSTDLPTTTVEADLPDGNLLSAVNPSSILTDKEVP